jgi:hypothetical protein
MSKSMRMGELNPGGLTMVAEQRTQSRRVHAEHFLLDRKPLSESEKALRKGEKGRKESAKCVLFASSMVSMKTG